ncbi:hypothetical protein Nepgr_011252 [Nepenthes gracilis]|uniref:YqaJ viral recombinase domain-containing protein n=1 Tax=Nepenthes gracilis TaxID=150966 RepID=A0AAD3SEU3_NEPGR|nr:hypothetical protein Nepgr_011252 [Nepenthes gracilis]
MKSLLSVEREVASSFCFLGHAIRSSFPICYGITQLIRGSRFTRSYNQSQFCQRCVHHLALSMDEYSVIQSSSLQHWFKNWQELRKNKLTASTFGGAVGFWPRRRVQLWLEHLGAIEPFSGNLATCWNNISEEKALERYKLVTGNTFLFPEFQVHGKNNPEDNCLAASPDGIVENLVYGLPSRGVLEIKCPFFYGDAGNSPPWKRIPLYYMPQAQGLTEIMDKDWMDFYVWTPIRSSLFRIDRDVDYWYILKIALSDFWWKHVQPAKELLIRSAIKSPLIELRSVKPEP